MADLLFLNPEDCVLDFQPLDCGLNHFGSICKPNGGSRGEARVGGGGGGGGARADPPPHIFLDQIEARGKEKLFEGDRPPPSPLSKGLDDWLPPPLISMSGSSTENDADYGFLNRFTFL